jgi:hypothetical protein
VDEVLGIYLQKNYFRQALGKKKIYDTLKIVSDVFLNGNTKQANGVKGTCAKVAAVTSAPDTTPFGL